MDKTWAVGVAVSPGCEGDWLDDAAAVTGISTRMA